jgi:hypothetical protein
LHNKYDKELLFKGKIAEYMDQVNIITSKTQQNQHFCCLVSENQGKGGKDA